MSRTIRSLACALPLLLLVALGGCASGDPASAGAGSDADGATVALGGTSASREADEVVTLDQCPAAVRKTIEAHLDGGSLVEIERTTDHGEVLYEVDVRRADGIVEFDVAENGAFRGYEGADDDDGAAEDDDGDDDEGDEEDIPLSQVPAIVREAAMNAVPGLVLEEAERETEDGTVVYGLEGEADGRAYEVEVSAAGEVLEIESGGDDDDGGDGDEDD